MTPSSHASILKLDEIRYGELKQEGRSVADLNGLNVALSDKIQLQFMEDTQATITITLKGHSEKMRHTNHAQNISFGWLKQQLERGFFNTINVDTKEQVADVFTKHFAENGKWFHALNLISHAEVLKQLWQKKQAPGTSRPRGQAGQFRT